MTQQELAEKLSVAVNTIYRWESEQRSIPPYLDLALKQIDSEKRKRSKSK